MDVWEKPLREKSPSFSSTLLDSIYRSIDESNGKGGDDHQEVIYYKEGTMRKKQEKGQEDRHQMSSLRRACMIERLMEKQVSCEKVAVRRKSMAYFEPKQPRNDQHHVFDNSAVLLNSSSSSSESSCGGGFSSSESDSVHGSRKTRSSSAFYSMQRPKPIRTSISAWPAADERYDRSQVDHHHQYHRGNYHHNHHQKPKSGGGFVKTKSKALKIYSDLKKVKQPISPGGRLASFLNSLFSTAGNAKKAKISSSSSSMYEETKLMKPEPESTCSSASSFSRSCLSKTPSSRGKFSNNGTKRSVSFCPVSVIVDEDCRPCGHKNLYENEQNYIRSSSPVSSHPINDKLQYHVMSESQRVEEAAREFLKNYQKKKEQFGHMRDNVFHGNEQFEDEDDDDAASYASSDLFELDNLSAIGIERYREELPVYETTHLDTNLAIASGLIL